MASQTRVRQPFKRVDWIIAGIIAMLLVSIIAIPWILNHRTDQIVEVLDHATDVAERSNAQIAAALSHEISAIVGFQTTGEDQYRDLYAREIDSINKDLPNLERIPKIASVAAELRATVDQWHADVAKYKFLDTQVPAGQFRVLLFHREFVFEHALDASSNVARAIGNWRLEERGKIGTIAQRWAMFSIVFGVLSLVGLFFGLRVLRRLRLTGSDLENRANAEEGLRQVAHSLTAALTLEDVLQRITQTALGATDAEGVYIETVNPAENEITCVAGYGSGIPEAGLTGTYKGSIAEEVISEREPKIIEDVHVESNRRSIFGNLSGTCGDCTAMIIPLISDSKAFGALILIRRHPRLFTDADFPNVRVLADMASVAIERAITMDRLNRIQKEEHFVSEAARILASSLDYNTTINAVVRLAVPQIADCCMVHLRDDAGNIQPGEVAHVDHTKLEFWKMIQQAYPPRRDAGAHRVVRTGNPELHSEMSDAILHRIAHDEKHFELLKQMKLKSAMVVPLKAGNETFGALTFLSEGNRRYGPDDLRFAENIARHAALAIENARLYRSVEDAVQVGQQALRAKNEMLRVVSHDLRNPISNIQMTAKMLVNPAMPEEKRQGLVQIIDRSSVRMTRLIEDLIAVARVREGQHIPLDLKPENPVSILDECCDAFSVQAESKSLRLICEKPVIAPTVMADRHRILQVLSNLVDNAIKFTPEGGAVTLRCETFSDHVRFSVQDTGRGIEAEHLGHIFDLFWQAKPTAHMGSGLGLGIAKSLVEQHGGTVWAESEPGLGTTFFFTLPQKSTQQQVDDQEKAG